MPYRDLVLYEVYAAKHLLPGRKSELLLAQLARLVAQTMGGVKDTTLQDFLFDPPEEFSSQEDGLQALKDHIGFNPRKKTDG